MSRKLLALLAGLIAANLLAWAWAIAALHGNAVLCGTALLAYGLGLRHAIDADHIAAIDNATRKLMQEGKRPLAAGLFFALGHSSVVLIAATFIALSATTLEQRYPGLVELGETVGALSSAGFLLGIATVNGIVLIGIFRLMRRAGHGDGGYPEQLDALLARRGLITRALRRLFGLISRSWHLFPLGLLFGLGFDTASEVGLLGIAASEAAKGLPVSSILVFPVLFAAGMALVDAADGMLMLGAYGWAFLNPIRKLAYNFAVTAISVVVAALVGGIEALGLMADKFGLSGWVWDAVRFAGDNLGMIGAGIIAAFVASAAVSVLFYRSTADRKIPSVTPT